MTHSRINVRRVGATSVSNLPYNATDRTSPIRVDVRIDKDARPTLAVQVDASGDTGVRVWRINQ